MLTLKAGGLDEPSIIPCETALFVAGLYVTREQFVGLTFSQLSNAFSMAFFLSPDQKESMFTLTLEFCGQVSRIP
jgi:hypothetical protein